MGKHHVYRVVRETNKTGFIKKTTGRFINLLAAILFFATTFAGASPLLFTGTAHAANCSAPDSSAVINEIYSNPSSGNEWVELYNKDASSCVDISHWQIKSGSSTFANIGNHTTIGAHGYYVTEATTGVNLADNGQTLHLLPKTGSTDVDTMTYLALSSGESYGRSPDGSSNLVTFSPAHVTKDAANYLAPVNTAPVATDGAYTTTENTPLNVSAAGGLSATDADGDTLTFAKVTDPSEGTLTLNSDGSFTYVPNHGFSGTDSFTFTANDGTADSNVATATITVTPTIPTDTTGPTLTVTSPTGSFASNRYALKLTGTVQDPSGVLDVYVRGYDESAPRTPRVINMTDTINSKDSGTQTWTITIPAGTLPDGHQIKLEIFARDNSHAQNQSETDLTVTADNTPPTVQIEAGTPANNAYIAGHQLHINFSASDTNQLASAAVGVKRNSNWIGGCQYNNLTGTYVTESCVVNLPTNADGVYVITVYSFDVAHNESDWQQRTITVDNTAPVINPVTVTTADATTENASGSDLRGTVTFHVSQTEHNPNRVYVEYDQLVNNKWQKKTGQWFYGANTADLPVDTTQWSDGTYQVKVSSDDLAWNHGSAAASFTVDNTAPVLTIQQPAVNSSARGTVTVSGTVTDNLSGATGQTVTLHLRNVKSNGKLDGFLNTFTATVQPDGTWSTTLDTTVFNDGSYGITGFVTDLAGNNQSASGGASIKPFTIDNTAPFVTDFVQQYNAQKGGRIDVTLTFSEPIDPSSLGQGWYEISGSNGTEFTKAYYGSKSVTVTFTDIAGNPGSYTFNVDNDGPILTVSSPAANDLFGGQNSGNHTITVQANASDPNNLGAYCVKLSGVNGGSCVSGGYFYQPANGSMPQVTIDTSNLSSGTYTLTVRVTDTIGNPTEVTRTIQVDTDAPLHPTNLEVNGQSGIFYTTVGAPFTQTWHDKSKDVVSYNYVSCYVDTMPTSNGCPGSSYTNSYSSASKQVNAGDTHHDEIFFWQVQAVDAAGNVSGWSNWSEVVVDSTLPATVVNSASQSSQNTVEFNGTVSDTNLKYYYCYLTTNQDISVNGNSYSTGEEVGSRDANCQTTWANGQTSFSGQLGSFDVTNLPSGDYTINLVAYDLSGNNNASKPATFAVSIDHTGPALTYGGYTKNKNVVTPKYSDPDVGNTYQWTADASNPNGATISDATALNPDFTVTASGSYKFTLTASDSLGNTTTTDFTFDYTAPATVTNPGSTIHTNAITTSATPNGGRGGGFTAVNGQVLGASTTTPSSTSTNSTTSSDSGSGNTGHVKGDQISLNTSGKNKTQNGSNSNFLGLGWWWLLILAAILAFFWFLFRRSGSDEKS